MQLNKNDYEAIKEDLIWYSVKSMHRYCKDSTIDKVIDLLDKEIDIEEVQDYSWDNYGE